MKVLTNNLEKQQCIKDITYRLNSMLAWDLMNYVKKKYEADNEAQKKDSVYDQSHVLEPALEISIVFGRQLLEFLKISWDRSKNTLQQYPPPK